MADIVQSLFGVTPEMYQQQQSAAEDKRAYELAQLTPFQRAEFNISRGAYNLGQAVGGALGAQDPQLQMISRRNAIARQIDPTNPESMRQGIQALAQANDTVGALQLTEVLRKFESEQAQRYQRESAGKASLAQAQKDLADIAEMDRQRQAYDRLMGGVVPMAAAPAAARVSEDPLGDFIQQRLAAEGAPAAPAVAAAPTPAPAPTPVQTRATLTQQIGDLERQQAALLSLPKVPAAKAQADVIGERIKDLRSQLKPTDIAVLEREIEQLRAEGVADTDPRIKNRQSKLSKLTSGSEAYGTDREAIAKELYFKPFSELTQAEVTAVNAVAEDRENKKRKSGASQFVLPGQKELVDIPAFRDKVQTTIRPQLQTITATDQAIQAIEDSLATNNFASFRAAQTQFARAIAGAGDLSQRELKAAGADPSLLGGTADYLSTVFSGTPTADTQKKILATLNAIRTVASRRATTEVEQQRKIALRSPGYNADAVTEALNFPELAARPAAAKPPIYARNPTTGERIMSTDGGATWAPAPAAR